jgi:hypothetical protein
MKLKLINYIIAITTVATFSSCEKALEQQPQGVISYSGLSTYNNTEAVIIGAYSVLNGQFDNGNAYNSPGSDWSFGDVRSGDAYKGSSGITDQININDMEVFSSLNTTNLDAERKWQCMYEGIKRCNTALQILPKAKGYTDQLRAQRIAEMRFLRGHYYFELKKIYNRPAYIDETAVNSKDFYVSNSALTNDQFWQKIENDFKAGINVLPSVKGTDPGRPTRFAAWAYLCKAYIFQNKWDSASAAADTVIQKGGFSLMQNYGDVFLPTNDNGTEIIFAVEHSVNEAGTKGSLNGSVGDRLDRIATPKDKAYPASAQGFFRPSQNLVNAYKTINGLPAHTDVDVVSTDTVDPRLDYVVARPGIPFFDYTTQPYQANWTRGNGVYGNFSPKKKMVSPLSKQDYDISNQGITDLNYYVIRYADVLLWKAEALIMLGDIDDGISYINQIRNRAKNSLRVKKIFPLTGDAANYNVEPYPVPFNGSAADALAALKLERRLELALEGHRFFDLVRWGDAATYMNNYFSTEKLKRSYLNTANFVAGKNEYLPIPQQEIDLSKGTLTQNPGY